MSVSVVLDLLRDAVDNGYDPPQALELALVAVVLVIDAPMARIDDPDDGFNRRSRWQYTLDKAWKLFKRESSTVRPRNKRR